MLEIIVKKTYIEAEHRKGIKLADKVGGALISSRVTDSKGDFADNLNNCIEQLNLLFGDISAAMGLCNDAIHNVSEEFFNIDELIANGLEVINKPKG